MSSVITFAANNDLFRKRKRVYRACESCKKRRVCCLPRSNSQDSMLTKAFRSDAPTLLMEKRIQLYMKMGPVSSDRIRMTNRRPVLVTAMATKTYRNMILH